MCLALPAQVVEAAGPGRVVVDADGERRVVSIELLDADVGVGDWLELHLGFALAKLDEADARGILALLGDLGPPGVDDDRAAS